MAVPISGVRRLTDIRRTYVYNFVLICVLFYSVYFMNLFCLLYICVFCVFVDPAFGCYTSINVCVYWQRVQDGVVLPYGGLTANFFELIRLSMHF